MALDRVLHGGREPRSLTRYIVDRYRAGKLELGEAVGMLWMRGMDIDLAYKLLTGE